MVQEPSNWIQCPNCDYICTKADLVVNEELCCPSCGDGYSEPEWRDPSTYLSEEQIREQVEYQSGRSTDFQTLVDEFLTRKGLKTSQS